jgi:hypothetical protein
MRIKLVFQVLVRDNNKLIELGTVSEFSKTKAKAQKNVDIIILL